MFELYTIEARRTIFAARDEADKFGSPYIETEHILLGIASGDPGTMGTLLGLSFPESSIRDQIVAQSPKFEAAPPNRDIPLSNEAKRALAYAAEEAQRLRNRHIGTEHLLLGILRETDSFAARMLRERGAEIEALRKSLASNPPRETPVRGGFNSISPSGLAEQGKWGVERGTREPSLGAGGANNSESIFRQYSEKSRRCIFYARYFVSEFGGDRIEPQHLLLAIVRETHPKFMDFEEIRKEFQGSLGTAANIPTSADVPLSEATKHWLQLAVEEARELGSNSIVPEHILLGIMREGNNLAANLLKRRGVDSEMVRRNLKENKDWSAPPTP